MKRVFVELEELVSTIHRVKRSIDINTDYGVQTYELTKVMNSLQDQLILLADYIQEQEEKEQE